ncbi:MAG TPA: hypothetical protein VGD41_01235, partial [Pyrinomonadaceae bacterium]
HLTSGYTNNLSIGIEGRFDNAGPQNLTMRVTVPKGLFTGILSPIDGSAPIPFKGALLQKAGYGSGFFLGTNQSGRILLTPANSQ